MSDNPFQFKTSIDKLITKKAAKEKEKKREASARAAVEEAETTNETMTIIAEQPETVSAIPAIPSKKATVESHVPPPPTPSSPPIIVGKTTDEDGLKPTVIDFQRPPLIPDTRRSSPPAEDAPDEAELLPLPPPPATEKMEETVLPEPSQPISQEPPPIPKASEQPLTRADKIGLVIGSVMLAVSGGLYFVNRMLLK